MSTEKNIFVINRQGIIEWGGDFFGMNTDLSPLDDEILEAYNTLISSVFHPQSPVTAKEMYALRWHTPIVIGFGRADDGKIVSSASVMLMPFASRRQIVVGDVATMPDEQYARKGWASFVLHHATMHALELWSKKWKVTVSLLTNSEERGNDGLYRKFFYQEVSTRVFGARVDDLEEIIVPLPRE